MLIWVFLIVLGAFGSVFYSPWTWLLLAFAAVTAVLPRAVITMAFSCTFGAVVSPLLSPTYQAGSFPPPGAWALSFGVWASIYLMLWLFVSTGLWRKKKPEAPPA